MTVMTDHLEIRRYLPRRLFSESHLVAVGALLVGSVFQAVTRPKPWERSRLGLLRDRHRRVLGHLAFLQVECRPDLQARLCLSVPSPLSGRQREALVGCFHPATRRRTP